MSIIRGEEVEFLSHGVTMGPEMIDPEFQHYRTCKICGPEVGSKAPCLFTPSQLKLKSPMCRKCAGEKEKRRKIGGVACDRPLGSFREWEFEGRKSRRG